MEGRTGARAEKERQWKTIFINKIWSMNAFSVELIWQKVSLSEHGRQRLATSINQPTQREREGLVVGNDLYRWLLREKPNAIVGSIFQWHLSTFPFAAASLSYKVISGE